MNRVGDLKAASSSYRSSCSTRRRQPASARRTRRPQDHRVLWRQSGREEAGDEQFDDTRHGKRQSAGRRPADGNAPARRRGHHSEGVGCQRSCSVELKGGRRFTADETQDGSAGADNRARSRRADLDEDEEAAAAAAAERRPHAEQWRNHGWWSRATTDHRLGPSTGGRCHRPSDQRTCHIRVEINHVASMAEVDAHSGRTRRKFDFHRSMRSGFCEPLRARRRPEISLFIGARCWCVDARCAIASSIAPLTGPAAPVNLLTGVVQRPGRPLLRPLRHGHAAVPPRVDRRVSTASTTTPITPPRALSSANAWTRTQRNTRDHNRWQTRDCAGSPLATSWDQRALRTRGA